MPARSYPAGFSLLQCVATPGVGNLGGRKFQTPVMEIIFPTKMGTICQERPSYPIICVHQGGKAGSQLPGLGCVFVSFAGTPGILPGRLLCIRKGGSATAGISDRIFLSSLTFLFCPSTRKCTLLSLLGVGGCRSVVKGRLRGGT